MLGAGRWPWVLLGALIPAAFVIGRLTSRPVGPADSVERSVFRGAVLTSPYLEGSGAENADGSLVRARAAVAEYLAERQQADPTLRVSLYARDLDSGPWIGINDRALYLPSSLTKVAVLLRALQREEEESGFLDRQLAFPGPEVMVGDDTMRGAPDSLRLQTGHSYPVRDLLHRMIVYSDNYAFELLVNHGAGEGMSRLLYDLSAEQYLEDGRVYYDARTVATMLRSLYNSSVLSRRHSEYALELLTRSVFDQGLRRHLPPDATVASKFGFHASSDGGPPHHEFHECGITYRPRAPYVVCVMTATDEGSPEDLQGIVGDVSRILWAR